MRAVAVVRGAPGVEVHVLHHRAVPAGDSGPAAEVVGMDVVHALARGLNAAVKDGEDAEGAGEVGKGRGKRVEHPVLSEELAVPHVILHDGVGGDGLRHADPLVLVAIVVYETPIHVPSLIMIITIPITIL